MKFLYYFITFLFINFCFVFNIYANSNASLISATLNYDNKNFNIICSDGVYYSRASYLKLTSDNPCQKKIFPPINRYSEIIGVEIDQNQINVFCRENHKLIVDSLKNFKGCLPKFQFSKVVSQTRFYADKNMTCGLNNEYNIICGELNLTDYIIGNLSSLGVSPFAIDFYNDEQFRKGTHILEGLDATKEFSDLDFTGNSLKIISARSKHNPSTLHLWSEYKGKSKPILLLEHVDSFIVSSGNFLIINHSNFEEVSVYKINKDENGYYVLNKILQKIMPYGEQIKTPLKEIYSSYFCGLNNDNKIQCFNILENVNGIDVQNITKKLFTDDLDYISSIELRDLFQWYISITGDFNLLCLVKKLNSTTRCYEHQWVGSGPVLVRKQPKIDFSLQWHSDFKSPAGPYIDSSGVLRVPNKNFLINEEKASQYQNKVRNSIIPLLIYFESFQENKSFKIEQDYFLNRPDIPSIDEESSFCFIGKGDKKPYCFWTPGTGAG